MLHKFASDFFIFLKKSFAFSTKTVHFFVYLVECIRLFNDFFITDIGHFDYVKMTKYRLLRFTF